MSKLDTLKQAVKTDPELAGQPTEAEQQPLLADNEYEAVGLSRIIRPNGTVIYPDPYGIFTIQKDDQELAEYYLKIGKLQK